MKKMLLLTAGLMLTGCVQVDNYHDVVKTPAPAELVGIWQTAGPQSALVSPEAIASLLITAEGDTLDCRQWQRVIALPGRLMQRSGSLYNVTTKREIYRIKHQGSAINYDGMTLTKVPRPTQECADFLAEHPFDGLTVKPQSGTPRP